MLSDGTKPFNTKRELFTEYSEKNRYLLDLIKKERRKIIDEKNSKKNSKNLRNNSFEKDKKRKGFQLGNNNLNSFNKVGKNNNNTNVKIKGDLKERNNYFSPKNKIAFK
jgi:hypothetical protein